MPVGQQDEDSVQEKDDHGAGARNWQEDQDIFNIPEALEITDKMRSQLTSDAGSSNPTLAQLPPRREEPELPPPPGFAAQ